MKLLKRKMQLYCVSNVMVSFVLTSFLGVNYCMMPENEISGNGEVAILDTDVDPLSQKGEDDEKVVTEVKKETNVTKKTTNTAKSSTAKKTVTTVAKKEVKASKTYVPASYSAVTGQAVVDYAMRYLGLRYVSGGYSLSTGTDCSGFTKLIYKEFGVTLSRAVRSQASNGTYVSKSNLQKGDLVFYGYGNGVVRHVGIYIGNGQVLHESNPRDGVKINSVNMMQYITARRVINSNAIKMVEEKIEAQKAQELANKEEVKEDVVLNTDNKTTEEKLENNVEKVEELPKTEVVNDNTSINKDVSTVKEESVVLNNNTNENNKTEKESVVVNNNTNDNNKVEQEEKENVVVTSKDDNTSKVLDTKEEPKEETKTLEKESSVSNQETVKQEETKKEEPKKEEVKVENTTKEVPKVVVPEETKEVTKKEVTKVEEVKTDTSVNTIVNENQQ